MFGMNESSVRGDHAHIAFVVLLNTALGRAATEGEISDAYGMQADGCNAEEIADELRAPNNWRTWSVSARDDNGQPFSFLVYAQDKEGAVAECEPELSHGLRVIAVHPA